MSTLQSRLEQRIRALEQEFERVAVSLEETAKGIRLDIQRMSDLDDHIHQPIDTINRIENLIRNIRFSTIAAHHARLVETCRDIEIESGN